MPAMIYVQSAKKFVKSKKEVMPPLNLVDEDKVEFEKL